MCTVSYQLHNKWGQKKKFYLVFFKYLPFPVETFVILLSHEKHLAWDKFSRTKLAHPEHTLWLHGWTYSEGFTA